LADRLTKEAVANENIRERHKRVPKSVVLSEIVNKSVAKCRSEWTQSTKGRTTKGFFPDVTGRRKTKINLTKFHKHGHRPWKNKLIFILFQNNRSADMPLRHK